MQYLETKIGHGTTQTELSFRGAEEAILAYRGALFSGDKLLTDRVQRQMSRVLDECSAPDSNVYREEGLLYIDRDAELILAGLRKQTTPKWSMAQTEYVHSDRAAQIICMLEEAGVALEPVRAQPSRVSQLLGRLIPVQFTPVGAEATV